MDNEVTNKVVAIVAAVKRVSPESIRTDASFDELGIDSLDRINILFDLENEFDIEVPDADARTITSVNGIIARLEEYRQHQGSKGV